MPRCGQRSRIANMRPSFLRPSTRGTPSSNAFDIFPLRSSRDRIAGYQSPKINSAGGPFVSGARSVNTVSSCCTHHSFAALHCSIVEAGNPLKYTRQITQPAEMDTSELLTKPGIARNRAIIVAVWFFLYASFTLLVPPLLDDADSVHAEVAREMLVRHDWITLYANGIRYLEKAPLHYWLMAASFRLFGPHTAAARLPLALAALALAFTLEAFARRA